MKFWLDAHLDPRLASWITRSFGIDAKSFDELGYRATHDRVIFEEAKAAGGVVIVTKDADFVELVARRGKPPQVVWLTVGNTSTPILKLVLTTSMPKILQRLDAGDSFVEISHA